MQQLDTINLEGLPQHYWEKLPPEKIALALTLSLPRGFRVPMAQLAQQLGTSPAMLSKWKHQDEVQELVRVLIRKHFFEEIPDIMEAMKNRAINGDARCAEIFLGYVDHWYPRAAATNVFLGPTQINITPQETDERVAELMRKTETHDQEPSAAE